MPKSIDLFIVGAQKCGTTSLAKYLGEHPDVVVHSQQEMSFFMGDDEYARGYAAAFRDYFAHNVERKPVATRVIAKHASLCHQPLGLRRLHEHNPACKLVMIVRNPVERAYSSFLMERKNWGEEGDFDSVLAKVLSNPQDFRHRAYLQYGIYSDEIANILEVFPREALRIVEFKELKSNPLRVTRQLFQDLGLDADFVPNPKIHNEGGAPRSVAAAKLLQRLLHRTNPLKRLVKRIIPAHHAAELGQVLRGLNTTDRPTEAMSPSARAVLVEFYRPHNRRLGELLGQDFSSWDH